MRYRNGIEILSTVLGVALTSPAATTRLMHGLDLSYAGTRKHVSNLAAKGPIERGPETTGYAVTDRGLQFLRGAEEINRLLGWDAR